MKAVEVKEQVRLSLGRCVELVLSGVKFRLFRASITVAIIALAVAFLMTMLSESLIALKVAQAVDAQTAPRKSLLFWVGRVSVPFNERQLTEEFGAAELAPERREEFMAWGALTGEQVDRLARVGRRQKTYQDFFAGLSEGDRVVLVGRAQGVEIFRRLQDKKNWNDFQANQDKLRKQLPEAPAGLKGTATEAFAAALAEWQETRPLRERILAGHAERLEQFKAVLAKRQQGRREKITTTHVFAEADEALRKDLGACGFRMRPDELETVRTQASLALHAEKIKAMLGISVLKQRLADRQNMKVADVNARTLFSEVSSSKGAAWLLEQIAVQRDKLKDLRDKLARKEEVKSEDRAILAAADMLERFDLSGERIQEVADDRLDQSKLTEVEASVSQAAGEGEFLGFSTRTLSLLAVSFLVCIVGIANAMLMSVTERFQEIATMKCLGATDGFIMINFVLESCLQGIAGGIVGALLGFLLGALRSSATYGWMAMANLPALQILLVAGLSLVAGVVISAAAAVYPAWVAARLAPMEAMRIE